MILGARRAVQGPAQPLNHALKLRRNRLSRQILVKPPKVAKDRKLEALVKPVVRKDVEFAMLHARATFGMERGSSVAGNFGRPTHVYSFQF